MLNIHQCANSVGIGTNILLNKKMYTVIAKEYDLDAKNTSVIIREANNINAIPRVVDCPLDQETLIKITAMVDHSTEIPHVEGVLPPIDEALHDFFSEVSKEKTKEYITEKE